MSDPVYPFFLTAYVAGILDLYLHFGPNSCGEGRKRREVREDTLPL